MRARAKAARADYRPRRMAALGPIFLLGMARRTGTNFCFQLLSLHPDVTPAARLPEDFAIHDAQLLLDRKSTRLNSSHIQKSRMPSSA